VTWKVNNSNKCKLDTITATGTFRMAANGRAGTVSYVWIRDNGAYVSPVYTINVAAGDTSAHSVVTDSWIPSKNGNEQLVFQTPGYAVTPQSFTCR
jgi:hypothetical protein